MEAEYIRPYEYLTCVCIGVSQALPMAVCPIHQVHLKFLQFLKSESSPLLPIKSYSEYPTHPNSQVQFPISNPNSSHQSKLNQLATSSPSSSPPQLIHHPTNPPLPNPPSAMQTTNTYHISISNTASALIFTAIIVLITLALCIVFTTMALLHTAGKIKRELQFIQFHIARGVNINNLDSQSQSQGQNQSGGFRGQGTRGGYGTSGGRW